MPLRAEKEAQPRAEPPALGWPSLEGGGSYLLLLENGVTLGNGTARASARGRALRATPQERLFWFENGGREYVIRDAATLARLKELFEPLQKLGEQQAKLGSQQAALGAKQGVQGAQQAEIGAKMAKVAAEQALLASQGENSASLEAQMQELEREKEKLAKPREELGRQQEALGRQQEELGRKLEELALDAGKQLKTLTDKAVASGLAQEVK